jgi:uncharacterized protein YvpB
MKEQIFLNLVPAIAVTDQVDQLAALQINNKTNKSIYTPDTHIIISVVIVGYDNNDAYHSSQLQKLRDIKELIYHITNRSLQFLRVSPSRVYV